jgi:predicted DNA-binding protein (MmcQ/YjbR family)
VGVPGGGRGGDAGHGAESPIREVRLTKPRYIPKMSFRAGGSKMTYEEYNAFCQALPAATYVVQWGGSHVWKVGGKVFAIGGWQDDEPSFTFKVSDIAYEMLKERPGLRPAPYLASRGMKWIQHYAKPGLSDGELRDYICQSHVIVAQGLSKKRRIELGLG